MRYKAQDRIEGGKILYIFFTYIHNDNIESRVVAMEKYGHGL